MNKIQRQAISAIRVLSSEAIDKAKSGHPGLPLGCATMGFTLFSKFLSFNPKDPDFYNRDRFVLSAGHGSMLLYSLLHIFGYQVSMEDIKNFRQLGSKTPGHPEYGVTPGVEVSTGPLGQGIANAVGFAIAETMMSARYNEPGFDVVDHYTYALCGDGCMMEGIESEAASLAGTLKLGKLIVLYDSNNITIEGDTATAFTEDVGKRHEAQGWQVIKVADGEDIAAITRAIQKAQRETLKPSLIIVNTKIGFGSELEGDAACHGAPLGEELTEKLKRKLGYDYPPFTVPEEVYTYCRRIGRRNAKKQREWQKMMEEYKEKYPLKYEQFNREISGKTVELDAVPQLWSKPEKPDAVRNESGAILNKLSVVVPNLVGGSADLSPSTKTYLKGLGDYGAFNHAGRNLHFGIREHAMAAICNGIKLHGGMEVFCSTFFVFSDYMRNAIRMSALMNINVIYILTHDSIGVGEDGPTHQPVEHLASLRAMPNINVFRPADAGETAAAYVTALRGKSPTCIVCSRQNLPQLDADGKMALRGGYIVSDCKKPDLILMASGSEVHLVLEAKKVLEAEGVNVRVISMPCMEVFDKQSHVYKESVLPASCTKRIAVEAGVSMPWMKYVGLEGDTVCMDSFGVSGKPEDLFRHFGFTVENVVQKAHDMLK